MGDKETKSFQLSFNGFLKVDFQGSRVTSDGGLLLVRELDERLGLGKLIDEHLTDSRQGTNKKIRWPIRCGNRSKAGPQATKTSIMPFVSPPIQRFACWARKRTGIAAERRPRGRKRLGPSC